MSDLLLNCESVHVADAVATLVNVSVFDLLRCKCTAGSCHVNHDSYYVCDSNFSVAVSVTVYDI